MEVSLIFTFLSVTPRRTPGLCSLHIAQLITHPAVYTLSFTLQLCFVTNQCRILTLTLLGVIIVSLVSMVVFKPNPKSSIAFPLKSFYKETKT